MMFSDWLVIATRKIDCLCRQDCEICCSVRKNSVFEPCKHSYACYDCAQNLRKRGIPCPICRTGFIIINDSSYWSTNYRESREH